MSIGGRISDIVVLTERRLKQLRVMRIWPDGSGVEENSEIPVFEGQAGDFAEPMGIALYRRPSDGSIYAIVGRKNGPRKGYLWQYRLFTDDKGRVRGEKVREFGDYSGTSEIEAIAVDDEAGFVYYADEDDCIRKWHADPDHPGAANEVMRFGAGGFRGNREGIAIYPLPDGEGYIICTDQLQDNAEYRIYDRKDPSKLLKVVSGGADSTDGIDATPSYLGKEFERGMLIAMNSSGRNFLVYRWAEVADTGSPKLK
jgi:3-phytase